MSATLCELVEVEVDELTQPARVERTSRRGGPRGPRVKKGRPVERGPNWKPMRGLAWIDLEVVPAGAPVEVPAVLRHLPLKPPGRR